MSSDRGLGHVVAHVGVHDELGAGDRPRRRHAPARRHQRVEKAVDHERRHSHAAQVPGAIGAGGDGDRLAGCALREERPHERLLGRPSRLDLVEVRSGDQAEDVHAVVDGVVRRASHELGQLTQQRRSHSAALAVPGVGHDRRHAGDLGRMTDGQRLGDHPAHRHTDDVGPPDAEHVEQAGCVVGHVVDRVVRLGAARGDGGEHHLTAGRRRRGHLGGQTDVSIVEPDHAEAPGHERLDELERPGDELAAESHHEQQRLAVVVAVHVVLDADAVDRGRSHGGARYPGPCVR